MQAHLKVAPQDLQDMAQSLFLRQAQHFKSEIKPPSVSDSLVDLMVELDNQFSARLRVVAAEKTGAGDGLLIIGDRDYQSRVIGKHHLLWQGGESLFDTGVGVLVVLDDRDVVLEEIERSYVDTRIVWLLGMLQVFNNKCYEDRFQEVQDYRRFQNAKPFKEPTKDWFGVEWRYHNLIVIQASTLQVVPRDA